MINSIDKFKMCREFIIMINSDVFKNLHIVNSKVELMLAILTLDEGPSLETSSFCLFNVVGPNITTQHSIFTLVLPTLVQTVLVYFMALFHETKHSFDLYTLSIYTFLVKT